MRLRLLATTALSFLAVAAPASAAEPIMPLGEVHAGMRCTGLTVIRGTDIASFDVEVVDVVPGDPLVDDPLILVRVSGPVAEPSGIAEGFSGSPVVCDGRIAGAIAYGTGDYGNRLGLATPIESLLGEPVPTPPRLRARPALLRKARPLATPLAVSGIAPAVLAPYARAAAGHGLALAAVPLAPIGDRFPVQELRPGASMAVGLAGGDVTVGAIGTVTYTDGPRVWGFGHPFDATGRRSLLLQDAWVYTVVDNPLGLEGAVSTKLAAPGHNVGSLVFDGRDGVTGLTGVLPPITALTITAVNETGGAPRTSHVQVPDETDVGLPDGISPLGLVAPMAVAQAGYVALDGGSAYQSARLCVHIQIRELPAPTGFCNRYVGDFGTAGGGPGGPYAIDLSDAIGAIDAFAYGAPHVVSVDADLHIAPGLQQAFLLGVTGPSRLRRGTTATLRLALQNYRGARFERTVTLRVPAHAPRGRRVLTLTGTPADGVAPSRDAGATDSGTSSSMSGDGTGSGPKTMAGLGRQIAALERYDGVFWSLTAGANDAGPQRHLYRDPQVRISGDATMKVRVVG